MKKSEAASDGTERERERERKTVFWRITIASMIRTFKAQHKAQ